MLVRSHMQGLAWPGRYRRLKKLDLFPCLGWPHAYRTVPANMYVLPTSAPIFLATVSIYPGTYIFIQGTLDFRFSVASTCN
jgi:hypothetical protein